MSHLDARPMDVVENALADQIQWVRADKKAAGYSKKFMDIKHAKELMGSFKKDEVKEIKEIKELITEKKPENLYSPFESQKVKKLPLRPAEHKYVPIPPDPEIATKVKEAKDKMRESGVDLPIFWRRVDG